MKKVLLTILTLILLGGCAGNTVAEAVAQSGQFTVISTIFPPYDWVREILGEHSDNFNLSFLTDSGVDLHNFQPSVSDIARISASDMFIYVGGHSDFWVEDVLANATNPDMIVINLMDALGDAVTPREHEGCTHDHHHDHHHHHHDDHHDCEYEDCTHDHHDHDHHHHDDHGCGHDHDYDEHVWLSLTFAQTLTTVIAEMLVQLDPDNADYFNANVSAYNDLLWSLDMEYWDAVNSGTKSLLLFADRFPFYYLLRDYGLSHYAAFPGCHAETEASFTTIASLINVVNTLQLHTILVTESSDQGIARTIARDSDENPQTLVLNSMQAISARDAQDGKTYLSIMRENLNVLREALR